MERLTKHHVDGNGAYMICSGNCIDDDFDCSNCKKLEEIVDRLAAYEDTGLMPEEIAAVLQESFHLLGGELPINDPLTLEELREMDGEPVWVVFTPDVDGEHIAMWALVSVDSEDGEIFLLNSIGGSSAYEEVWADIEAIYRRKPEEAVK